MLPGAFVWSRPEKTYDFADISCKKAKTVDSMEIQVLKSGNYKMDAEFYSVTNAKSVDVKGYKITTTIK